MQINTLTEAYFFGCATGIIAAIFIRWVIKDTLNEKD